MDNAYQHCICYNYLKAQHALIITFTLCTVYIMQLVVKYYSTTIIAMFIE